MLWPLIYLAADEPAAGAAAPAAEVTPEAPTITPEATEPAKGTHPWDKSLETRFEDPVIREQVSKYMLEEHAPYTTRIEQERAAALEKSWLLDEFTEDPLSALAGVAEQLWGEDKAKAIMALVEAGESVEGATEIVEEAIEDPEELDLSKMPKAVREAMEFIEAQKVKETEREAATQQAEAEKVYAAWLETTKAANPDIPESDIHAYVQAYGGDLEAAIAAYRVAHPTPAAVKPTPPPVVGGHSTGGIMPSRPHSSLAEAFGAVFDGAAGSSA